MVFPEALARLGISERVELRFGLPSYVGTKGASGLSDASLGVKLELGSVAEGEMAVIGEVSIPLGDDQLTSDEVDPTVIAIYECEVNTIWSLGTQVGLSSLSQGRGDETVISPTLVFGRDLAQSWGTFFELAADIVEDGSSPALLHTGLTKAAGPDRQWDVHFAFGLNDTAPDVQVGAGFSWRF